ncbi:MAG: D-erythro-7,8-dihydroneopterin triphosphate 2'-epimerase [Bacteroidetes bacterium ADurb.BinA245]|nr:MAG: D-erythro-7,8-dihydroneopterin triphosphate 2'-epimerase [Bacteroidetes bacterium ADurb.BinA245]
MDVWLRWMQSVIWAQKEYINKMQELLTISLNNLRFHAFHGLYHEEQNAGNDFIINLKVTYEPKLPVVVALHDTLDYGVLFDIIKTEMKKPRHLLETFVMEVADIIYQRFNETIAIEISLEKTKVPLTGFTGSAVVRFTKNYSDE